MRLYDAQSYFDRYFEEKLEQPGELERQLEAHAGEHEGVLEAIRVLGGYAALKVSVRRLAPKAARTLSAATMLEWLYAAGGTASYSEMVTATRRRHRRAGVRVLRVFKQLEEAGVLVVDRSYDRPSMRLQPTTVRFADELMKVRA